MLTSSALAGTALVLLAMTAAPARADTPANASPTAASNQNMSVPARNVQAQARRNHGDPLRQSFGPRTSRTPQMPKLGTPDELRGGQPASNANRKSFGRQVTDLVDKVKADPTTKWIAKKAKAGFNLLDKGLKIIDAAQTVVYVGDAVLDGDVQEAEARLYGQAVRIAAGRAELVYIAGAGTVCALLVKLTGSNATALDCYAETARQASEATETVAGFVEQTTRDAQEAMEAQSAQNLRRRRQAEVARKPGPTTAPAGPQRSQGSSQSGGGSIAGGGGDVRIVVSLEEVSTTARGANASALTEVGAARTGSAEVEVSADRVTTSAETGADVYAGIGVSNSVGSDATASVNDVTTTGGAHARATTEIAIADRAGRAEARVGGDVTNSVGAGGSGQVLIGVADGGRATADVRGDVTNSVSAGSRGSITIGQSNGGNVTASVRGDVTNLARGGTTTTEIGVNKSAHVGGDVLNLNGSLSIGGGRTSRHGRACKTMHRGYCVWDIKPKGKHGCPPRYYPVRGMCYLYSDFRHRVN